MNLKKVYSGFTKDGKARVFFKQYNTTDDGFSYTVYKDLKSGELFDISDIEKDSLVLFGNRVSNGKRAFKRKVVRAWKNEMNLIYHVDNLYLGDKYEVEWITPSYISKYYSDDNIPMGTSLKEINSLFVKVDDDTFKDLRINKLYKKEGDISLKEGDICIKNLRQAKKEIDFDLVTTKHLALSKYNKYCK